ncbi:MAG: sugar transferase [Salinivirgaceae bacterium]|nr:sugar transferase [Salinivirgaceae bacterium]
MYKNYFKRILDFLFSLLAIIVLSPLLLLLMIIGFIAMSGNPFFTQQRPGKDEKIFRLIKFRSMNNKTDKDGNLLPDEDRLTSYGKFLRSTSLDELPELFNILKGDMAIVGPRPLLVKYLERYTPTQRRRHEVRPGLTGLAMSTIRNSAGWDKKFELDVEYVDKVSFLMDLKIILWTIRIVLKREGINEEGEATNSEFMGILNK